MVLINTQEKMQTDVSNHIEAEDSSRPELVLEAEIHLPRARCAVVGSEEIETVGVRCIQRSTNEIGVGLCAGGRSRGLKSAAECQNLIGDRRDRASAERRLHLVRTRNNRACTICD